MDHQHQPDRVARNSGARAKYGSVVVIMPRIGVLVVKVMVHVPQGAMEGAVLAATFESFLVGALMHFGRAVMEAVMSNMIARVIVVVVACDRRR
jgi:hypothetical protein